jgi:hypothetical protein
MWTRLVLAINRLCEAAQPTKQSMAAIRSALAWIASLRSQ